MPLQRLKLYCALGLTLVAGCATPNAPAPTAAAADSAGPATSAATPAGGGPARIARSAGVLKQGADKVQWSFIVKNTGLPGGISTSGTIGGTAFKFQAFAADLAFTPGEVTFSGAGRFNDKAAKIVVKGSDADPDAITISFDNGLAISGPVSQGHIDISDEEQAGATD